MYFQVWICVCLCGRYCLLLEHSYRWFLANHHEQIQTRAVCMSGVYSQLLNNILAPPFFFLEICFIDINFHHYVFNLGHYIPIFFSIQFFSSQLGYFYGVPSLVKVDADILNLLVFNIKDLILSACGFSF